MHFNFPESKNCQKVFSKAFWALFLTLIFTAFSYSKESCPGNEILSGKSCVGDEITAQENELANLINDYRKKNGQSDLTISDSLSLVANRHLLDISRNFGYPTHSWSDCAYKTEDAQTWDCIFKAPKKFDASFSDTSFEIVYFTTIGEVVPNAALSSWKKSSLHNSTILNLDRFSKYKWNGIGVAIEGKFAALWFSAGATGTKPEQQKSNVKGLGISFQAAIRGLTSVVSINNVSSSIDSDSWVGTSPDKSIVLEMFGKTEEIAEGKMSLKVKLGKDNSLSSTNQRIMEIFIRNLAPRWADRNQWLETALKTFRNNPSNRQMTNAQNVSVELGLETDGYISLTIKPKLSSKTPFEME